MTDLKAAWIEPRYLRIRLSMLVHRKGGMVKCHACPISVPPQKVTDDWTGLFDDKENLHGALCPNCSDKLQSHNLRYGLTNTRKPD